MDYSDTEVCERLGISKPVLRDLLKNLERDGNTVKKGRALRFTEAGVLALATLIGKSSADEKNAPKGILGAKQPGLPDARHVILRMVVVRSRDQGIKNGHVLMAHPTDAEAGGAVWTVRVRDNANYIPGMHFHGRVIGDHLAEAWDVVLDSQAGVPRSKGRL
jgi:hypothetical protein